MKKNKRNEMKTSQFFKKASTSSSRPSRKHSRTATNSGRKFSFFPWSFVIVVGVGD